MLEIKQTKYVSVTLNIPGASAIGIYNQAGELDSNYDVCDGVCFTEITNGTITNGQYSVALNNNNGVIIEPVPIQAVATTKADGSDPNKRFVDVLFDCKSGKNVKLEATIPAIPAAAMVIQATFRLRRLLKPVTLPN